MGWNDWEGSDDLVPHLVVEICWKLTKWIVTGVYFLVVFKPDFIWSTVLRWYCLLKKRTLKSELIVLASKSTKRTFEEPLCSGSYAFALWSLFRFCFLTFFMRLITSSSHFVWPLFGQEIFIVFCVLCDDLGYIDVWWLVVVRTECPEIETVLQFIVLFGVISRNMFDCFPNSFLEYNGVFWNSVLIAMQYVFNMLLCAGGRSKGVMNLVL